MLGVLQGWQFAEDIHTQILMRHLVILPTLLRFKANLKQDKYDTATKISYDGHLGVIKPPTADQSESLVIRETVQRHRRLL